MLTPGSVALKKQLKKVSLNDNITPVTLVEIESIEVEMTLES